MLKDNSDVTFISNGSNDVVDKHISKNSIESVSIHFNKFFFFLIQTKFLTFLMLARILVERDWLWLSLQFSCNFKSNTTIEQALRIYFATFIFNDNIIWHRNMLNHKYTLHSFQMWIITYSIKTFFIYIQLFHRRRKCRKKY